MSAISKLPQQTQILLLTLIIGGFCGIFYVYYVQPLREQVVSLEKKVENLEVQVQKGRLIEARLPEFKQQVREQEQRLNALRQVLPEEKETPEIVRRVEQLAKESRLRIKSFTPKKTVRRDFYEDWPILISLEGNYDSLGVFFEKIGQFTRVINVDNIAIKGLEGQSQSRTLAATCTATTFVFVESPIVTSVEMAAASSRPRTRSRAPGR
jgi:type IV pilus assembly protein PilO